MRWIALVTLLVFGLACGNPKRYLEEQLFLDLQISGEEGSDSVSLLLHFRNRGEYGPAMELASSSAVYLDDESIPVNRSSRSGPLYASTRHLEQLKGEHRIRFLRKNGKYFEVPFRFEAFQLVSPLQHLPANKDAEFRFSGLKEKDRIRVLMTDTSFFGEGITRIDSVRDNAIRIKAEELSSLTPGPVQLELIREQEIYFDRRAPFRGRLARTYTIRHEFFLDQ